MACGAFTMITNMGGAQEYAVNNLNSVLVDPFHDTGFLKDELEKIIDKKEMAHLKYRAIVTASEFNVNKASLSLLSALS